jgi:hypothetical protein
MSSQDQGSINFSAFVLSLHHNGLMHLGEQMLKDQQDAETHLPMAKQFVDILSMLENKTKNNLDDEEAALIKRLLFDLRMRYVEARDKHAAIST